MNTLRGLYIEKRRIVPALFEPDMLKHTLYPHARLLCMLLPAATRRLLFDPDLEFVRALGNLRSRREFGAECSEFMRDPVNRSFVRGKLRIRVSCHRSRAVVDELFKSAASRPPP